MDGGESKGPSSREVFQRVLAEAELLLAFTFLGIAGNTGRAGLIALTSFEDLDSIWPNFTGCVVMGMTPLVFNTVLAPVITTGFCGAMTSFSQMVVNVFVFATTPKANWPNHGYGVPMFIARLILEFGISCAGFLVGTHLGRLFEWLEIQKMSTQREIMLRRLMEFLGLAAWIVCLVTTIVYGGERREWALGNVFAPFGVFLRYYTSKFNRADKFFKWGTFFANIFGTFLTCIFEVCWMLPSTSALNVVVLKSLQSGFIGSLTTISTFVRELNTMPLGGAYLYGATTIFCGYSLAFIIIGSYIWTR